MRDATLAATAVRERGLLNQAGMEASRRRARPFARARSAQGFSLIEMLMVVAIMGVLGGIAIGRDARHHQHRQGPDGRRSRWPPFLKRTARWRSAAAATSRSRSPRRTRSSSEQRRRARSAAIRCRRRRSSRRSPSKGGSSSAASRRPRHAGRCSATPLTDQICGGGRDPVMFTSEGIVHRRQRRSRSTRRSTSAIPDQAATRRTRSPSSAPPPPCAPVAGTAAGGSSRSRHAGARRSCLTVPTRRDQRRLLAHRGRRRDVAPDGRPPRPRPGLLLRPGERVARPRRS